MSETPSLNILVTGGAGFVGHHLVPFLLNAGHKVWVVDDYSSGRRENHDARAVYIELQTQDMTVGRMKACPVFDLVFHLAEYSRIVPSFDDVQRVWESNSLGTMRVLELARHHGAKIIYAASSTRYADEGRDHSPYSLSKAQSVDLVKAYTKWYGLRASICYFYNVFGPGADTSPVPGFESVLTIFARQWRANQPLTICGDGSQRRAFTYVGDVVNGLWKTAMYTGNLEVQLTDTNAAQYSVLEVARMFSSLVVFLPPRPGDRQASKAPDDHLAQLLLGWHPTMSVPEWVKHVKSI